METKDFKARIKIKALPEDVYACFTNTFTIELWSGYPAEGTNEVGREFSMLEGDIVGKVLELTPNSKIVQKWYFGDQEKESIVTIKIFPNGNNNSQVDVEHTNIPDEAYDDITEGWNDYFLGGIKDFLEFN